MRPDFILLKMTRHGPLLLLLVAVTLAFVYDKKLRNKTTEKSGTMNIHVLDSKILQLLIFF